MHAEEPAVAAPPPAAVVRAQALLVGTGIDITALGAAERAGGASLAVDLPGASGSGTAGLAVLFRSGAAVFIGVSPSAASEYLLGIAPRIRQPFPTADRETESLDIRIEPGARETIEGNVLVLDGLSVEKAQLVADVMAKSVSLAHHEREVDRQFERIEPFAVSLDHWGRGARAADELLQHLGAALLAEHRVVAGARIDDAPDLLWDHPELERLWARIREEFEIRERFALLHGKLALVSRTAETALGLLQNRRALRVEYAIVGLIVFEILITLVQWWVVGRGG